LSSEYRYRGERLIPALDTIRTMLKVTKILSLVLSLILIIWGFVGGIIMLWTAIYYPAALVGPLIYIVFGVVDYLIFVETKEITALVKSEKFEEAKEKTLVWAVIGLVLGAVLPGVFLLIAYIKYDEVLWVKEARPPEPPHEHSGMEMFP